jgi:hypothetical protein
LPRTGEYAFKLEVRNIFVLRCLCICLALTKFVGLKVAKYSR